MSLIYMFAASNMEGEPVEQIIANRISDTPADTTKLVRSGVNEFVLITGGMGPKRARTKATAALGLVSDAGGPEPPAE